MTKEEADVIITEQNKGTLQMKYKFTSIDRTLGFIKPLLVEGNYAVSIRTLYKEFPREYLIDYFEVTVEELIRTEQ